MPGMEQTQEETRPNAQIRTGMNPLYICGQCGYTPVHHADGPCRRCKLQEPPPDLGFITLMADQGLELRNLPGV